MRSNVRTHEACASAPVPYPRSRASRAPAGSECAQARSRKRGARSQSGAHRARARVRAQGRPARGHRPGRPMRARAPPLRGFAPATHTSGCLCSWGVYVCASVCVCCARACACVLAYALARARALARALRLRVHACASTLPHARECVRACAAAATGSGPPAAGRCCGAWQATPPSWSCTWGAARPPRRPRRRRRPHDFAPLLSHGEWPLTDALDGGPLLFTVKEISMYSASCPKKPNPPPPHTPSAASPPLALRVRARASTTQTGGGGGGALLFTGERFTDTLMFNRGGYSRPAATFTQPPPPHPHPQQAALFAPC